MKEVDPGVKWFRTVWYPENKTGRSPLFEDRVLPRLRQEEVTLFTPWGPRYGWESRGLVIQQGDKEMEVLNFLAAMFGKWKQNMPGKVFNWLFLGADLYGTRINNLPEEVVRDYFSSLNKRLMEILPTAKFRLWSKFDKTAETYRQTAEANFDKYINRSFFLRTVQTAKAIGGDEDTARAYIIERMAEAELVNDLFQPIKVSCVARGKDDVVDRELPRLYLLPENLHAPWM